MICKIVFFLENWRHQHVNKSFWDEPTFRENFQIFFFLKSALPLFLGPASQPATAASSGIAPEELDPELVRYLDRDYWEQKEKEKAAEKAKSVNTQPSSLQATSTSNSSSANAR